MIHQRSALIFGRETSSEARPLQAGAATRVRYLCGDAESIEYDGSAAGVDRVEAVGMPILLG